MNFIKSELFLVLCLFCLLNSCATKEEEHFNSIPKLSIQEIDFLRGNSVIKINTSGSWKNSLRIKEIELFNGTESLGKQSKNISGIYSIPFDSKILPEGINQLTAVAILEGVSSLKENSITIDFDVEVDNYIPNIFIENGYIESKNRSNKFSLGDKSSGNYVETFISNYTINFVLLNKYGDVISEVSPSKSFVGTPKGLLIPEKSTDRNFFLSTLTHYLIKTKRVFNGETITTSEVIENIDSKEIVSNAVVGFNYEIKKPKTDLNDLITVTVGYPLELDKEVENDFNSIGDFTKEEKYNHVYYTMKVKKRSAKDKWLNHFYSKREDGSYAFIVTSLINNQDTLVIKKSDYTMNTSSQIITFNNSSSLSEMYTYYGQISSELDTFNIGNIVSSINNKNMILSGLKVLNATYIKSIITKTCTSNNFISKVRYNGGKLPIDISKEPYLDNVNTIDYNSTKVSSKLNIDKKNLNSQITINFENKEEGNVVHKLSHKIEYHDNTLSDFNYRTALENTSLNKLYFDDLKSRQVTGITTVTEALASDPNYIYYDYYLKL
ncbi:iron-sulfur cluster biosynthesis family protein [Flammeovirga kamogawensis]|uniref:Iron-sulfur cluster biosynthesis family protein n=1 Tax=Flammeovirga kamogawensis TaxID=373891 RepID=A0ABX8H3I4_9BACT|nr:iron-sulfur cluster biosynthesis family protein [Flammeovirga kamogawensis]MBB6460377.1 cyclophilin family peptidyl-prolyl cis-trans isomerase [Flammeovirga kamogawensis]QWG10184.1 iron-sulfur cluster biosynthesis family protein [Flammeovirga kamogawensis]TRX64636.1 iron-sulfur cluster biosynthesis family protein [Flammeovirga kamogawensis]